MKTVLICTTTHSAANYEKALLNVGITPVLSNKPQSSDAYDGLLLPGGGDITPFLFHEKNSGSKNCCLKEDIIQLLMFHRFFEQNKPILGICKGMQLINVALGGSIIQDDPLCESHTYHNGDRIHHTHAVAGSIIHTLYGNTITVNSAHHQSLNTLGAGLLATQYADNHITECIEHKAAPILGVQWHPERLLSSERPAGCVCGLPIFQYFRSLL